MRVKKDVFCSSNYAVEGEGKSRERLVTTKNAKDTKRGGNEDAEIGEGRRSSLLVVVGGESGTACGVEGAREEERKMVFGSGCGYVAGRRLLDLVKKGNGSVRKGRRGDGWLLVGFSGHGKSCERGSSQAGRMGTVFGSNRRTKWFLTESQRQGKGEGRLLHV